MYGAWLKCFGLVDASIRDAVVGALAAAGVATRLEPADGLALVIVLLDAVTDGLLEFVRDARRRTTVLAVPLDAEALPAGDTWRLMAAGASDVCSRRQLLESPGDIATKLDRLERIRALMRSPAVRTRIVGDSPIWGAAVRDVVEAAALSDASVLVLGESGTGKELLARLVHDLDPRPDKGDFVVVDCAAIVPELSGSEFFGHERGAFTGAATAREGAFAVANGGTLFLDEVGELPLSLQAQLLRVVQEHQYKRVGSNTWQHTAFRLVCATNRDLDACVVDGRFRGDLYYRIAGWVCRVPPLRDRPDDIVPLALHFLSHLGRSSEPAALDVIVQRYLVTRDYPGNVRDLRQLVTRIWHRHGGRGPITPGDIPPRDRPAPDADTRQYDDCLEAALGRALDLGQGMKQVSRRTADILIRLALEREQGNLHRAACRLGLTDRALQLRRAAGPAGLPAHPSSASSSQGSGLSPNPGRAGPPRGAGGGRRG